MALRGWVWRIKDAKLSPYRLTPARAGFVSQGQRDLEDVGVEETSHIGVM